MPDDKVSCEECYGFFKTIDYYMPKARSVGMKNEVTEEEKYCNSFLNDSIFAHVPNPNIFCAQFKRMYELLHNSKKHVSHSASLDDIDRAFLNYWLNDKLRGINIDPSICVNEFYKQIKAKNNEIFKDELLDKKLHNIEKHELENMRSLYDLYNIMNNVSEAITEEIGKEKGLSCLRYTKECYRKYKEAIINCRGYCPYFYSLIKEFKKNYKDELSPLAEVSFSCKAKELFELPNYGVVLKEHESVRIIRNGTLSVLLPLLGFFLMFKFSNKLKPFRQYIQEKLKSKKSMLFDEGERENELFSYTFDDDSSIFNDGEYNLSYYNIRNY